MASRITVTYYLHGCTFVFDTLFTAPPIDISLRVVKDCTRLPAENQISKIDLEIIAEQVNEKYRQKVEELSTQERKDIEERYLLSLPRLAEHFCMPEDVQRAIEKYRSISGDDLSVWR